MELFEAMENRRSCRAFSEEPVPQEALGKILEAAVWAPSPLNAQPWEFVVVSNQEVKEKIAAEAERCRDWALEASGWKWLKGYGMEFLKSVPVMIVVVGDPRKSGVDAFQEEGGVGYQHACAAAIQNMLLASHGLGFGSLWFTFFDKDPLREILGIGEPKTPVAIVCVGKPAAEPAPAGRKGAEEKTRYVG
jgi:nitroreductase